MYGMYDTEYTHACAHTHAQTHTHTYRNNKQILNEKVYQNPQKVKMTMNLSNLQSLLQYLYQSIIKLSNKELQKCMPLRKYFKR